ncbi:MAG: DUF882 domain-containing protein [Bacteroidales bacterium]|nr:DUF882 domain-containing protein [Bacteroidales bacterium]
MKYFTISELLKSDTAIKNRIWNGANREIEDNLIALVAAVLDPLREKYGKAIHVSSGYRCPAVNKSIPGSSLTSQHMQGEAADIFVDAGAKGNFEIGKLIVQLGNFDQVIFENVGVNDLLPQWIHVSWKRQGYNRHQIRKKVKGQVTYPILTLKDLGL